MAETKVLTPNNVTEANSTTNGEVQTGMLIFVTPKATTKKKNQYYSDSRNVHLQYQMDK